MHFSPRSELCSTTGVQIDNFHNPDNTRCDMKRKPLPTHHKETGKILFIILKIFVYNIKIIQFR